MTVGIVDPFHVVQIIRDDGKRVGKPLFQILQFQFKGGAVADAGKHVRVGELLIKRRGQTTQAEHRNKGAASHDHQGQRPAVQHGPKLAFVDDVSVELHNHGPDGLRLANGIGGHTRQEDRAPFGIQHTIRFDEFAGQATVQHGDDVLFNEVARAAEIRRIRRQAVHQIHGLAPVIELGGVEIPDIGDLPDIIQHGLHVLIGVPPHVLKRIDVDESLKIQMGFGIGIHHARTCPDILLQGVAHHQIQNGEDRYRSDQDSQRDRQDDFLFGAIPVCFSEQSHPPSPKKALISAGRLGICFNNGGNHRGCQ